MQHKISSRGLFCNSVLVRNYCLELFPFAFAFCLAFEEGFPPMPSSKGFSFVRSVRFGSFARRNRGIDDVVVGMGLRVSFSTFTRPPRSIVGKECAAILAETRTRCASFLPRKDEEGLQNCSQSTTGSIKVGLSKLRLRVSSPRL